MKTALETLEDLRGDIRYNLSTRSLGKLDEALDALRTLQAAVGENNRKSDFLWKSLKDVVGE